MTTRTFTTKSGTTFEWEETKETVKVDLDDGSLLVMSGLSQQCWVHQIAKTAKPVGPRINLTFRLVQSA